MLTRKQVEATSGLGPGGERDGRGCRAVQRPLPRRPGAPVLMVLAALVTGCASDEERTANATFGESVRLTIAQQTAYPKSAGTGLDGVKAAAILDAYRKDLPKREDVKQPLTITVQ